MENQEYRISTESMGGAIDTCGTTRNELGKQFYNTASAPAEGLTEDGKELLSVIAAPDTAIGITIKPFQYEKLITGSLFVKGSSAVYVNEIDKDSLLTGMNLEKALSDLLALFPVKGVLSESGGAFKISKEGVMGLIALADHARRERMEALLAGNVVEQDIPNVKQAMEQEFNRLSQSGDMRFALPFMAYAFSMDPPADSEKSMKELNACGVLDENGALTLEGKRLIFTLSYAEAMEALAAVYPGEEGFLSDRICFIRSDIQMWKIFQAKDGYVMSACSSEELGKITESLLKA